MENQHEREKGKHKTISAEKNRKSNLKIDAKTRRKNLEEKMEELESPLSVQNKPNAHSRSPHNTCLARKRPTKKSKDALSAKARVKPEVCMKIKLRSIYIKRRKQKKNIVAQPTHRVYLLGETLSL